MHRNLNRQIRTAKTRFKKLVTRLNVLQEVTDPHAKAFDAEALLRDNSPDLEPTAAAERNAAEAWCLWERTKNEVALLERELRSTLCYWQAELTRIQEACDAQWVAMAEPAAMEGKGSSRGELALLMDEKMRISSIIRRASVSIAKERELMGTVIALDLLRLPPADAAVQVVDATDDAAVDADVEAENPDEYDGDEEFDEDQEDEEEEDDDEDDEDEDEEEAETEAEDGDEDDEDDV